MRQDTGDTRETPAIDVCKGLIADGAKLVIFDPKVTEAQINHDLATPKFEWDHPQSNGGAYQRDSNISVVEDAYKARAPLVPTSVTVGACPCEQPALQAVRWLPLIHPVRLGMFCVAILCKRDGCTRVCDAILSSNTVFHAGEYPSCMLFGT